MPQPDLFLFLDTASRQIVRSTTTSAPAMLPMIYQGDTLNVSLRFMEPTGNPTAPYQDIDYSSAAVTVLVSNFDSSPYVLQTNWTASFNPDVLTSTLSFNTTALEEAMGNSLNLISSLAVQVTPAGGLPYTVYQGTLTIQNDLVVGSPTPTESVSYYTENQSDARYVRTVVQRDSSGNTPQHVVTAGVGVANILYLLTNNVSGVVSFNFDNGTFDGQTITYRTDANLSAVIYSSNVSGVGSSSSIYGVGASLSFVWDSTSSLWFPL